MATSDNVLTKLHDLLLYIIPQLGKFPRDEKFLLADRIETRLLDVQERCIRAYYRHKRAHRPRPVFRALCAGNEQQRRVRAGSRGFARGERPDRRSHQQTRMIPTR